MKKLFYACLFLMILQFINHSSVYGQASVYSSKRGGVTINIDDSPDTDGGISTWESYRLLFNKYGFKFNIALQSESLNRPLIAAEVKQMMSDGHEMLDHCPQDNVSQFRFNTHMEDSSLYVKSGVLQPGIESVNIGKDQVIVTLKTGTSLDPSAIPVLAERTRLLYRRYLNDNVNYPKILAQPGDGTSVSQIDGYISLKQAGYTAAAYDGIGKDNTITKTYSIKDQLYHPAYNFKRADWGDLGNLQATTKEVADRMAKHQLVSILFHYPSIPGLLDVTDKFLKWCTDNDVPLLTLSQWMTNIYGSSPDPSTNVFPDITKDRNADGKPDGYEPFDANVIINKNDAGAPGGSSLTKNAWGNMFQISQLGGIEKGKNAITFSAKGQLNASIRIKAQTNGTGQSYCDTTIILNSLTWKTYNAIMNVPDNANFSDVSFALENLSSSSNSVSISNWQLSKVSRKPIINILRDTTITTKQFVQLTAEPGCTNYRWNNGKTSQTIIFDGSLKAPGTYQISYSADDASGNIVSDKATIILKGLLYSPKSFTFPASNSNAILKITANIPWTISRKNSIASTIPSSDTTSADVSVSMLANTTVDPVIDTLILSTAQDTFKIPIYQPGILPVLSVSPTALVKIPKIGKVETIQITTNANWKITHIPSWITSTFISGKGNTTLALTISNNSFVPDRADSVVIKVPNGLSDSLRVSISVYQLGEDHYLNLIGNTINAVAISTNATINVFSNTKWTASNMPNWIIPRTITGTGNGLLVIDILTNPLRTERTGTFKVSTANDTTRIVTVKQTGADYVDIDRKAIPVAATATIETVNITASTPWTLANKFNWLTPSPSNGTNNAVKLTILENIKIDPRKDTITVKAANCSDQYIVVNQAGAAPKLTLDKSTVTVLATAYLVRLTITSNTTWTITDVPTWITPSQLSGNGSLTITLEFAQNKLMIDRTTALLKITPKDGAPVLFEVKQLGAPSSITPSTKANTFGPAITDTTSFQVSSNIKWKIVNAVGWIKTDPDAWIINDGDKRVKLTPVLQWLTKEDITGADLTGSFTLEEDSPFPTKVIQTVNVTLKSYPGILSLPIHDHSFQKIESKTITVESNLPWTIEKKPDVNWLNITPSSSLSGSVSLKIDCIMSNAGSKDNSVYLIIKQAKGVVKDSILVIQAAKATGISDYEHSGIKIYPQPARETLNVELPANNAIKNWTIYNTIGVELLKGRIENNHTLQIPMIRLVSGVYFITLESDTQKIGLKFTK